MTSTSRHAFEFFPDFSLIFPRTQRTRLFVKLKKGMRTLLPLLQTPDDFKGHKPQELRKKFFCQWGRYLLIFLALIVCLRGLIIAIGIGERPFRGMALANKFSEPSAGSLGDFPSDSASLSVPEFESVEHKLVGVDFTRAVVYAYHEKSLCAENLAFFLKNGNLEALSGTIFVIVVNGFNISINIPFLKNVVVVKRPNVGLDFGAYSRGIKVV